MLYVGVVVADVRCLLQTVVAGGRCVLFVVRYMLLGVVRCLCFVVRCLLFAVCCSWFVVAGVVDMCLSFCCTL